MIIKEKNYLLKTTGLIAGLLFFTPTVSSQSIFMQDLTKRQITVIDDCPELTCGDITLKSDRGLSDFFRQNSFSQLSLADTNQNSATFIDQGFSATTNETETVAPQIVFLNFDAGGNPTFPVLIQGSSLISDTYNDHIYTPEERDEIQQLIEDDYADFNFVFTQEEPLSGPFTTIRINENDRGNISINLFTGAISILFGRAESIDFLNLNKSDGAFVDASLWEFLAQSDPTGRDFTNFSGIPITTTLQDAVSIAIVNQTANTAAHELGHILGLRHQDSFGALGQGLPPSRPRPDTFKPAFPGARDGTETFFHTMASGASAGISLRQSANANRFFSERSASKLTANEDLLMTAESQSSQEFLGQPIALTEFEVANTIEQGVNADKDIDVRSAIIAGSIDEIDELDRFSFSGEQGEVVNVEIVSFTIRGRLPDSIISTLTLYLVDDEGNLTELDSSIQTFEGFDPFIFDYTLPQNGTYIVEVATPDIIFIDSDDDGESDDQESIDALGGRVFRTGDYRAYFSIFDSSLSS